MEQHPAAITATQPIEMQNEKAHPLYKHYLTYKRAMIRRLVTATTFASWLESNRAAIRFNHPGARYDWAQYL